MTDSARRPSPAWWVTMADVLSLVLPALALLVAASGGFRGHVAGVFVSVTSPWRLLLLAVVILAARHFAFRRPSLPVRVMRAIPRFLRGTRGLLAGFVEKTVVGARPRALELLFVAGLMVILTFVMLYPQARHLDSVTDLGDPLFSIWRVAWVAHQLATDPLHLYDANIFWPEPYALAHSDGMPLTGAAAAPFIWLGARPAVVYNIFVLGSFVLSGLAMYAFVRSLVGSPLPAVVSAVAFAFYPFRYEHYIHLELLSAFWMPLVLWALHRTLTEPRGRWRMGLLTGAGLAAQYLSGMYFGVFLGSYVVVIAVVLALAWKRAKASAMPLMAGAALAGVLVAPTLVPYLNLRQAIGDRPSWEVRLFSAQPTDYLKVHHPNPRSGGANERQVYPGALVVVLALVALWPPLGAVRTAYLLGLAFAFEVSLGSNGFLHPLLYEWCLPFKGLRAPARFSMLVGLSLAVLAGYGASRLLARLQHRGLKVGLAAVLCGVILYETHPTMAMQPVPAVPPVYEWFKGRPTAAIVEVPVWYPPCPYYLIYSIEHWQRLANGFSGSVPASYLPFHFAMRSFPDESALSVLRARDVSYAVIHEEFYGTEDYRKMIERVERSPALSLVSRATDGRFEARIYQLSK